MVRSVLLEAVVVAAVGIVFSFAANQISPRGLVLTRNYFPAAIASGDSMRPIADAMAPAMSAGADLAAFSPGQLLAEQMRREGLQLIDDKRVLQLFHHSQLNKTIVFIDARDESQYSEAHIPGAYEFDPYHPDQYFPVILPLCQAAEQIVVYCNGGDCDDSENATLLLKEVGIAPRKLFVYGGGISEWTKNRLPVETGARKSAERQIVSQ
jgi:rhodanese-related sulfurtransferase